ncbi:SOS response-associated peptidase [Halococcus agarilyticus]|uniref:SOS response-associated peptidase n=1 Tax=Halococcus agarilyticus TaxID=1232219 RepID=UPI00067827EA|nr:SOS response-associated peptidase [Halococcus agarilyticus]
MCGRYTIFTPPDDLEDRFGATARRSLEPRYNAAPGQKLPVITNDAPETIDHLQWGLIPGWADDPSIGNRLINARAETVDEKRSFRAAYERRRCLVLADGFYEWTETDAGKQPYRVMLADGEPFALAGLWERWQPPQKQTGLDEFDDGDPDTKADPVETFTIVTTEPNSVIEPLHDRMAVVLPPDGEQRWLDGEADGKELLEPYQAEEMRAYPVSTAVNNPSNDSPALVEEVDAPA